MLTENDWNPNRIVSAASEGSLVLVVQLCLSYLFLDYDIKTSFNHFHVSQVEAYADHAKQPVFVGKWKSDINVRWLISTLNFFTYHFKSSPGEGVLCHEYGALPRDQLPQPWLGKLHNGTQILGSNWKGAYSKQVLQWIE